MTSSFPQLVVLTELCDIHTSVCNASQYRFYVLFSRYGFKVSHCSYVNLKQKYYIENFKCCRSVSVSSQSLAATKPKAKHSSKRPSYCTIFTHFTEELDYDVLYIFSNVLFMHILLVRSHVRLRTRAYCLMHYKVFLTCSFHLF